MEKRKEEEIKRCRAWVFRDNIDTDVIIPARYLNTTDHEELGSHCMEDIDKDFTKKVKDGDIIIAGENFGCGSSREHAPIAIKACGVSAVIAKSFARIFFRNSINIGLPILENKDIADETHDGDEIEINLETGEIKNITRNKIYSARPFPQSIRELISAGGLVNYTKTKLEKSK